MAPIDINNQEISSITLNGSTEIDTVTVNGQEVFSSSNLDTIVAPEKLALWYPFENGNARDETRSGGILDNAGISVSDNNDYSAVNIVGASHSNSNGVVDLNSGQNSGKFNFDGNDYITTGYNRNKDAFTYVAWYKANQSAYADIIDAYEGGSDNWARLYNTSLEPAFTVDKSSNKNDISAGFDVNIGEWVHHAGVRRSNGDILLYVNGVLEASDSHISGTIGHVNNERIGSRADGNTENAVGDIDDVRIYDDALSSSEINQIYQNTKP